VRVIARRTLIEYAESLRGQKNYKALKAAMESWFHEAIKAAWKTPADVQRLYRSASIVSSDRVVFNIKGNSFRLVTAIDYKRQAIFIKWIGTHADYDKIDVRTVQYGGSTS
jgi:mRNA interferase HigB